MNETELTTVSETSQYSFQVGLGGTEYKIAIVPIFDRAVADNATADPQGRPGNYKVVVILGRPGFSTVPERKFLGHEQNQGDSHLAIAPPALQRPGIPDHIRNIEIHAEEQGHVMVFKGYANDRGFLGTIVADSFHAENVDDAVAKVAKALTPALSNLAAHLDVPLRVQQSEIIELPTAARHFIVHVPYNDAPFLPPAKTTLSDDFKRYVNCYREALGSNTPAYQFLCFFKIVEAVRKQREERASRLATAGKSPTTLPERLPSDEQEFIPWVNSIFPVRPAWDDLDLKTIFLHEARGKKLNRIVDELRPLRDAVAHAVLDDMTLVDDDIVINRQLLKWLPLTKCIARRMLKTEFPQEFLTGLHDADAPEQ